MFDQQKAHIKARARAEDEEGKARVKAGYAEALEAADRPSEADKVGVGMTYVCFASFGLFGAHRVWMGRRFWPTLLYAVTGGYFFVGWLYDLFTIPAQVKAINKKVDRAIERDRARRLAKR